MHPFNLSSFYWPYVNPWNSTTLWWMTMHLGFCSSLGFDNGGTHAVQPPLLDNTPSLLAVPLSANFYSQHTLLPVDLHPGVFPCVRSASLVPGKHLVLDPARMQQTANGMVNSPWRNVASHCKHRQALLGALAHFSKCLS